jgi:hypothetical protein
MTTQRLEAAMAGKRSTMWFGAMLFGIVAIYLGSTGCGKESFAEHVSRLRAGYTATLNGFVVQQQPLEQPAPGAADESQGAVAEAPEEATAPAVQQNVVLDILVRNDNDERLPGLTLDVTQADRDGHEKATWKVWVDSSGIGPGPGVQLSHVLKDVDYQQGDGFNVEVRTPIQPAERSDYREFEPSTER